MFPGSRLKKYLQIIIIISKSISIAKRGGVNISSSCCKPGKFVTFKRKFDIYIYCIFMNFMIIYASIVMCKWIKGLWMTTFHYKCVQLYVYAHEIEDRGILFLSRLSSWHSDILSETLTLLLTFEKWELELWYFTCIPSGKTLTLVQMYQHFRPCDHDHGVLPFFWQL